MYEKKFETPILLLIFNRPDVTKKVFDEIRKIRPAELYVAADGPRKFRPTESEACDKTRAIIKQIDWKCEVSTLFRDKNLGCKEAIRSAIDWFFKNVNSGIILEDDCVPDYTFFGFCQELLNHYKDNERVMMVSGTNYLFNKFEFPESYFFSTYYAVWGWATWKRAWNLYDKNMSTWPEYRNSGRLRKIYRDKKISDYFERAFQNTYENKINTWDYQWFYSCMARNGLAAVPKYNLISNLGFAGIHANGKPSRFHNMPIGQTDPSKLVHPSEVCPNLYLDKITLKNIFSPSIKSKIFDFCQKDYSKFR